MGVARVKEARGEPSYEVSPRVQHPRVHWSCGKDDAVRPCCSQGKNSHNFLFGTQVITGPLQRTPAEKRDAAAALAEQAALESGTVQAALEARTQTATAVVVQPNVAAAPGPDIKPSPAAVAAAQAAAAKSAAVMQWDDE